MAFRKPDAATLPQYPVIIGDKLETRGSGDTFAHIYPATGTITREITLANPTDVDRADLGCPCRASRMESDAR